MVSASAAARQQQVTKVCHCRDGTDIASIKKLPAGTSCLRFARDRCIDLAARCYLTIIAKRENGKLKPGEMRSILKAVGDFNITSSMIHSRLKQIKAGKRINDILPADLVHVNRFVFVPNNNGQCDDDVSTISDLSVDYNENNKDGWKPKASRHENMEEYPTVPTIPAKIEFRATAA